MALFVDDVGLVDEWFTLRDLRCCYVLARMTAVDEYSVRKNEQLTFVDFLAGHAPTRHSLRPLTSLPPLTWSLYLSGHRQATCQAATRQATCQATCHATRHDGTQHGGVI